MRNKKLEKYITSLGGKVTEENGKTIIEAKDEDFVLIGKELQRINNEETGVPLIAIGLILLFIIATVIISSAINIQ